MIFIEIWRYVTFIFVLFISHGIFFEESERLIVYLNQTPNSWHTIPEFGKADQRGKAEQKDIFMLRAMLCTYMCIFLLFKIRKWFLWPTGGTFVMSTNWFSSSSHKSQCMFYCKSSRPRPCIAPSMARFFDTQYFSLIIVDTMGTSGMSVLFWFRMVQPFNRPEIERSCFRFHLPAFFCGS